MRISGSTCDTSVLVAALDPTSPFHEPSYAALMRVSAVPAHVLLETYRVLTAMPGERRYPPLEVVQVLGELRLTTLELPAESYLPLLKTLSAAGRGAIYDAQIAATAKHDGFTLLTRDRRAAGTYALVGVEVELVG